ncbi:RTA1 like protein-domain-containing protein [Apodospora peruviana]|uniref:RTA1 like protein-domain-containing protein n=1 Tax=Apodospora peruviana TaxID=516989 RepID=A0AAE0I142_9PEZI|nr:RTA1 like protein-domain-containing protein [Apodospora peruviana]
MATVTRDCTADTCPVTGGFLSYPAGPAGSAFMVAAFAALIPVNLYTGVRYRTPLYVSLIIVGLLLEIVGHVGKILLHADVASPTYFSVYMVGTLWGPTFTSAAIFTILPHVMVIYGPEFRLISHPIYLNMFFLIFDIFALAFQSVGAVFTSNGTTASEMSQGLNILLAGLAMQVASLVAFGAIYWYFRLRLKRRRYIYDPKFAVIFLSSKFKVLLLGVQVAAMLLLLRAIIRIAAFSGGLVGVLAQSEVVSYVFDDTPVLLACIILSAFPVGKAFGSSWDDTTPGPLTRNGCTPSAIRLPRRSPRLLSVRNRVISQPYPTTSSSLPQPSPRPYTHIGRPPVPPINPPNPRPVYQRPAYDLSPAAVVPFMAPEHSPSASLSPIDRKKKIWASPPTPQLVNPNSLWS